MKDGNGFVHTKKEQIIFYTTEEKKIPEIPVLCMYLKLRCHLAGPADFFKSAEEILAGKSENLTTEMFSENFGTEPMLILCNLSARSMNSFLSELKKRGIRIPLKAALTPTNAKWKLSFLYEELRNEHKALTGEDI